MQKIIFIFLTAFFCANISFAEIAHFHKTESSDLKNIETKQKELKEESKENQNLVIKKQEKKQENAHDQNQEDYLETDLTQGNQEETHQKATESQVQENITQEKYSPDLQLRKITQNIDNPKAKKSQLGNFLGVSGLVNADLRYQTKPEFQGKKSAKVSIAQTKLNFDAKAGDWLQGHIGLFGASRSSYYYPAAKTSSGIDLDEAYVTVANLKKLPFYVRAGRQYLPFSRYHRYPILKSLTQQLSEIRATSLQLGALFQKGFYGAVYTFQGEAKERYHHDKENHYGAVLGYARQNEKVHYDVSVNYLDNMLDVGAIYDNLIISRYNRQVAALALNGSIGSGPFDFAAHYVTAVREFLPADFSYQAKPAEVKGAKPKAFDVSAGYAFKMKACESRIQLGYEHSYQAYNVNTNKNALRLPRYRLYAIYGIEIYRHIILALEGARDRDYSKQHGGTNKFNDMIDARVTYLLEE